MRKYLLTVKLVHSVRQLHPNEAVDKQAAEDEDTIKKHIEPSAKRTIKDFGSLIH